MLSADRLAASMAPGTTRPRRDSGSPALTASGASHAEHQHLGERLNALATQAARLDHRRRLSLAAAERLAQGPHTRPGPNTLRLQARLVRFARRARIDFHRTIDDLVYAGGYDLAMSVLAERRRTVPSDDPPSAR
jgi:hypothetical protein